MKYIDILTGKNSDLLSKPGTYAVVSFNKSEKKIPIGKLGKFIFKRGYYIYTGSALGIGGINSRITRHLKKEKSKHWHMDYMGKSVNIIEIWYYYGDKKMECKWASVFDRIKDYEYPVKGFGSSDCKCYSHLIYSQKRPFHNELQNLI